MKRKSLVGWVGKTWTKRPFWKEHYACGVLWGITDVFITKGRKKNYSPEDYPPVKVRITIEEIKP